MLSSHEANNSHKKFETHSTIIQLLWLKDASPRSYSVNHEKIQYMFQRKFDYHSRVECNATSTIHLVSPRFN
jgi:hypothetical protein